MSRFAFGIAALAFVAFMAPVSAQDQPVRVRGTVERVEETPTSSRRATAAS